MKMTRYSEPQILAILRQAEAGVPVAELCREHGMSTASFYKWRAKYGGMDASMIAQTKALEDENRRLKKMFAELSLQNELLKEALGKSNGAISTTRDGRNGGGRARGEHRRGRRDYWLEDRRRPDPFWRGAMRGRQPGGTAAPCLGQDSGGTKAAQSGAGRRSVRCPASGDAERAAGRGAGGRDHQDPRAGCDLAQCLHHSHREGRQGSGAVGRVDLRH